MRLAAAIDMEPGFWFRAGPRSRPLQFVGVEPVVSRFAGKSRVRVLCSPGPSFIAERDERFQLIDWSGGRG